MMAALIFGFSFVLRRWTEEERPRRDIATKSSDKTGTAGSQHLPLHRTPFSNRTLVHAIMAAGIFLGLHFTQNYFVANQVSPVRKSFAEFQMQIGGWEGRRQYLSREILDSLWADDYVTGAFQDKSGSQLTLLVSYYKSQTTYHTAHAPTSCLVGSGWDIRQKEVLPVSAATGRTFPVHQIVLEKEGQLMLANFWFQERGRVITSEFQNKMLLFWDAVTKRRTDGALVRAEMMVRPGQPIEDAQRQLDGFTSELKKKLSAYIPE
jgi:EpsI family protein